MEEIKDIIAGLEQRINLYKKKLNDLQKKKDKLEDEIKTVKRYLEITETLYRVEYDKSRLTDLSDDMNNADKESSIRSTSSNNNNNNSEQLKEILMGKSKYVAMSIAEAAFLLLTETGKSMHAKEIYQKLIEGGVRIRAKAPITSVSIALSRDKRFKKSAPNTYDLSEESATLKNRGEIVGIH